MKHFLLSLTGFILMLLLASCNKETVVSNEKLSDDYYRQKLSAIVTLTPMANSESEKSANTFVTPDFKNYKEAYEFFSNLKFTQVESKSLGDKVEISTEKAEHSGNSVSSATSSYETATYKSYRKDKCNISGSWTGSVVCTYYAIAKVMYAYTVDKGGQKTYKGQSWDKGTPEESTVLYTGEGQVQSATTTNEGGYGGGKVRGNIQGTSTVEGLSLSFAITSLDTYTFTVGTTPNSPWSCGSNLTAKSE